MHYDYLIVGAGFAGCVLAERLASQGGKKILLIDKRSHIGGNAYDEYNEHGILIHRYGPHLFHTNDRRVFQYLSQFTHWRNYEYRVLASVGEKLVSIPINRKTVNELLDENFQSDEDVRLFFEKEREQIIEIENSEDYVVSRVGRRLYGMLYAGYTRKQWGIDPRDLLPSVCGRLPIRTNLDDRYFDDEIQVIPSEGYTVMFRRMINHPNIELVLHTEFKEIQTISYNRLIFTGRIDEYFDFYFGELSFRSLRFEFQTREAEYFQSVPSINYPGAEAFTRTTEYKHITGQTHLKTTIATEYPCKDGEPFYTIPQRATRDLFSKYKQEAEKLTSVYFIGRLANYEYFNMDQIVARSLSMFEKIVEKEI